MAVSTFAYRYGSCDASSIAAVEAAGYAAGCGIDPGFNDAATPLFRLRRTEILGTCSLLRFALALWLGKTHLTRGWL